MEQNLVYQFIGSQFTHQAVLVKKPLLVERKGGIYLIVGHGSVDYIVPVLKAATCPIAVYKSYPVIIWGGKIQKVQFMSLFLVPLILTHITHWILMVQFAYYPLLGLTL